MKVTGKWSCYDVERFEITKIRIDYCCEKARESEAIKFGEFDSVYISDANMNIASCSPYPEGAAWDEEAINFCPFCGIEIEVNIED